MILPIVAYGHPVLRTNCKDITKQYPDIKTLIENMWDTLYNSNGVGLAAPQINKPIRLFIVDTFQIVNSFEEEDKQLYPDEIPIKQVFINAHRISDEGEMWAYNEGCLSIPKIREDVKRPERIRLQYLNEHFEKMETEFFGITARVIMHEYDHIDGKLFIDYLPPLKKRLLKKKLNDISNGKVKVDYRMLLP